MSDDPQSRFEDDHRLDPRLDSERREGLTGTTRAGIYERLFRDEVSAPPQPQPQEERPQWRKDFAIDWPEDQFVARRDFAKFLVLTSAAFSAGQGWIAVQSLIRSRRRPPERKRIASLSALPAGSVVAFDFPGEHDPCLLIRAPSGQLVAYSQQCTHLSCAVVPRLAEGVLHCPCHEGYFDLLTGNNIAGPPPRPLSKIDLEVDGDDVYAIALERRTV